MKKLTFEMEIEIPTVPNFFRAKNGGSVSISEVSQKSLRAIGKAWTDELVKKAAKKKEN